ncbi:hypothetical protein HJG60_007996 [Phyllostomus discolor]|uniref:Uncharacterized protein n=1 Tax=Phyllostomus discolor TaxID=89673 RepID=A0A834ERT8_9CHIR|nr:hypothetical protein HJG60_007996 [Phyllostomus discolor]
MCWDGAGRDSRSGGAGRKKPLSWTCWSAKQWPSACPHTFPGLCLASEDVEGPSDCVSERKQHQGLTLQGSCVGPPLSGLDQRALRGGSPGAACFCTIFSGRTCDPKVTPSLQNLDGWVLCPGGWSCERMWRVGPCPPDEELKRIPGVLAGACAQIGGRRPWETACRRARILADSVEEHEDPASFL